MPSKLLLGLSYLWSLRFGVHFMWLIALQLPKNK